MAVNEKLSFICKQIENNKLSHAFLLETNNINDCYLDVKQLIKQINCPSKFSDECNKCNLCKLININNLPSFISVSPDGMGIKRLQIEDLEEKFSQKPVFSRYNIYVVLNAEKMNESASNTILKFLEEPEDNIVGFFITSNKNSILPTIVSRCEYSFVQYDSPSTNLELFDSASKYLKQIIEAQDYFSEKQNILLKYPNRDEIDEFFKMIFGIQKVELEKSFNNNELNMMIIDNKKRIDITQKVLQLIKYNVNLELILDYYSIEMRRTNG